MFRKLAPEELRMEKIFGCDQPHGEKWVYWNVGRYSVRVLLSKKGLEISSYN